MKTTVYLFLVYLFLLFPQAAKGDDTNKPAAPCKTEKQEVEMKFAFDTMQNMLTITFDEDEVKKNDPEQLLYFQTHTVFPFEEEFELPPDICEALGTSRIIIIKTGQYPIRYLNGSFEILICL